MLHPTLQKKISHPDIIKLYNAGVNFSHPSIKPLVSAEVRKIRTEIKQKAGANTTNVLEDKLTRYKNKGEWFKTKVTEANKPIFNAKAVSNDFRGHWRSIEFECVFKSQEHMNKFVSCVRAAKLINAVQVKDDGSLRRNDGDGIGVCKEVTITYRLGEEKNVHVLCELLNDRAYVNKTCGTHIHFDMRHLVHAEVITYARRLARCVPALKTILPQSRRQSEYCNSAINNVDSDGRTSGHRYAFVNLHAWSKYKTIEVRGHAGTLKADKILNWFGLCEKIMGTDLTFKPNPAIDYTRDVNTINELIQQYDLGSDLTQYLKDRYVRFSNNIYEDDEIPIIQATNV